MMFVCSFTAAKTWKCPTWKISGVGLKGRGRGGGESGDGGGGGGGVCVTNMTCDQ